MPIPRFHLHAPLASGAQLMLAPDAAHHASRVLRLREGDSLVLFNGEGGEFSARIVQFSREGVAVEVGAFSPIERESLLAVTLVQGISAGDRMDLTIQKAVELGAVAVQPVLAERSVVRLKGERGETRREHWRRVAVSACEQCGRNRLPSIAGAIAIGEYRAPEKSLSLLLSPDGTQRLSELAISAGHSVVLASGPEAGFSPREEATFISAGFLPVRLGPRILRTETAGPAALAALNALYGDG
jgi:16S rRNA (uracil1498-N3)-methyltransferase